METIISYIENNISWIKDIFTLILVATATIISILAYRRARATVLQPIRNEVIKKQSLILSEVLAFLPKTTFDKSLDYVGVASVNAYLALRDYGFVFRDQKEILDKVDRTICGWLFCGEGDVIKDVEVIGMFAEDKEKEESIKEAHELGKERFENAKKGIITIDKIYLTQEHEKYLKQLSEYAENPFLPRKIQEILEKLISDVQINLKLHLKNTLTRFVKDFCQSYFSKESYPKISPLGVYNEFNHNRIHHGVELNNLKTEVRNYLKIDDKW